MGPIVGSKGTHHCPKRPHHWAKRDPSLQLKSACRLQLQRCMQPSAGALSEIWCYCRKRPRPPLSSIGNNRFSLLFTMRSELSLFSLELRGSSAHSRIDTGRVMITIFFILISFANFLVSIFSMQPKS